MKIVEIPSSLTLSPICFDSRGTLHLENNQGVLVLLGPRID